MNQPRSVSIFTHQFPEQTDTALERVIAMATAAGAEVRLSPQELEKHPFACDAPGVVEVAAGAGADLGVVLGGDGTILGALRMFAGRDAPVFSVNFGEIGFLSTVDAPDLETGIGRALTGDYEVLALPALTVELHAGLVLGINDVSFHRRAHSRVAELQYSVAGEQLGSVRCDGLVAATPVGSTGYNLANAGPVLAWGVEGYVVSFIAPHTLTARALVVAPGDTLSVLNLSTRETVDVSTDGRIVGALGPGEELDVGFMNDQVLLAQLPGSTFYHRFRDKFGRLAQ